MTGKIFERARENYKKCLVDKENRRESHCGRANVGRPIEATDGDGRRNDR